ncbi:hypothetical protein ACRXCV_16010 [Halobacteriovorax sp. GFR7]|uniref:hypothetical protein n=1 Tax=unclassified Halobacteriovorax TaxID=2639665 RepID=UPI003D97F1D5
MACSGGHCSYHNTGTATCSGHRGVCSANRTYGLSSGIVSGGIVYGSHVRALRNVIAAELTRYRSHSMYNPANPTDSYARGVTISNSVVSNMTARINQLSPANDTAWSGANPSPADNRPKGADDGTAGGSSGARSWSKRGQPYTRTHLQEVLNYYNTIRADCICNSDCNCNAVCSCHNNCGCHY